MTNRFLLYQIKGLLWQSLWESDPDLYLLCTNQRRCLGLNDKISPTFCLK